MVLRGYLKAVQREKGVGKIHQERQSKVRGTHTGQKILPEEKMEGTAQQQYLKAENFPGLEKDRNLKNKVSLPST